MNAQDIRNAYLQFFKDRQHEIIARAPLQLKDDPTTLFTGSGMQPLLPYLLGKDHPAGVRLADSQTCLRAQDIDDVGDNRHTTFFEMLGNWSMGDYFKEQQIRWFFEFLTDVVGLDPNKLYVTAFIGDEKHGIPRDLAKKALATAERQGRFTIFSLVDALTRHAGEIENAGDRLEADERAGKLLALVASA